MMRNQGQPWALGGTVLSASHVSFLHVGPLHPHNNPVRPFLSGVYRWGHLRQLRQ